MLKSILRDYSDVYIVVSRNIAFTALAEGGENDNIELVIKTYAPFTDAQTK